MKRKPGEPIYLGRHVLALVLAIVCPGALPHLYHVLIAPITVETRLLAGLLIAVGAGLILVRMYSTSAKNEP
ncbi:MAG: hypothetical protein ABL970_18320 [Nitrospira sp.]